MSDNTNKDSDSSQQNEDYLDFVNPVSEFVSTDSILDIKSGIFNLFTSLYNKLSAVHGPIVGLKMALDYLNSITSHFQEVLEDPKNN